MSHTNANSTDAASQIMNAGRRQQIRVVREVVQRREQPAQHEHETGHRKRTGVFALLVGLAHGEACR